jgi:hypothetical protein
MAYRALAAVRVGQQDHVAVFDRAFELIEEAADFVGLNVSTLQARAKAGTVRGSKPGKRWVFLESDLIDYLRSLQCRSDAPQAANTGTSTLQRLQAELDARLGPRTGGRRRNITTSSRPASGGKSASVIPLRERGARP